MLRNKLFRILVCFFLSGAAGLIYEVAWVKALGLIFGHSVYAVAVVLAAFMAGVAAGSAYLGRWAEGSAGPIALYARIEFLAAFTGALSLAGLYGVRSLYIIAYPAVGSWQPLLIGLRFLGAAAILFIPTFLMGGTLPVLVAGTARNCAELANRVSQLYWINTAGAVFGTLISGFVLLPAVGLRLTIAAAAALNAIAGLIALRTGREGVSALCKKRPRSKVTAAARGSRQVPSIALLFLFAIVGCTAFAYEVAWTRQLAVSIGSSTYAFTLMLATFLAGSVIGSAAFERFMSHPGRISMTVLFWAQIGIGAGALSSLVLFHWTPTLIPPLLRATQQTFAGLVLAQLIVTMLTVFPAALVFGFNFPLVIALFYRNADPKTGSAASVGTAYAANTVGAIVGSIVTGFWLIPWLGSFRVIAIVASANLLLALWIIQWRSVSRRHVALAINLFLLLGAFLVGSSSFFDNRTLLSFSAVLYGNSYEGRLTLPEIAATKDLVFMIEGVNDSISVVRTEGNVALRVNGKVDASTDDTRTQLLLGHLGTAFHRSPKRVLIIGFGSGMTASAVAGYPDVEKIDCVEIEPAVIRAAPYLQSLNRNVLSDRRLHIIFDDARNFLLASREKYDLIISEPSNPWIAGVASLFTDEYYAGARQRLAPGGMFVQWVQAYSLAPADLRMILASFAPHFSGVTVWRAGETDLLLLGRTDNSRFQFGRLTSLWQNRALQEDFASMDIHQPEGLAGYFLLDDSAVRKLAKSSVMNTDDRTLLEYDAPHGLLARDLTDADQELITQSRTGPLPANLEPSEVRPALEAGLATALDLNDTAGTKGFLRAIESEPESACHDTAKGRFALTQGNIPQAKAFFESALKLDANSPEIAHWMAVAEQRSGDTASALSRIKDALKRNPRFLPALKDEMEFAADQKDFQTALSAQLNRMALMPNPPAYEYGRLGALWIEMSNLTEAESVLLKGLSKDHYCYACHFELGELYLRTNQLPLARRNFEWVVRFFPDSDAAAFRSLTGVDLMMRDTESARDVLDEGLRLFPEDAALLKARASLGD